MKKNNNDDRAGQHYWNEAWRTNALPQLWNVGSNQIRHHVEKKLFEFMRQILAEHGYTDSGKCLIEVGCARSAVLPLFAKRLGFRVAGLDYSPIGCDQSQLILERERVTGDVYCHDIFSIPDNLKEKFDVVVSFGLIEHFADTKAIVAALSKLLKPGGLIITNLPNMNGLTGLTQRLLDHQVYDIHVPLTAEQVLAAHKNAGLNVIYCNYFLSTNFGVCNLNNIPKNSAEWWLKKIILAILARLSMVVWRLERLFGDFPVSKAYSPYINCVATKPIKS
jgi:2-polyprenyl-3-methyl-5-hydroxy-6-metoxy-1,4-benzoquinol methylase